jgi:transporter family protein
MAGAFVPVSQGSGLVSAPAGRRGRDMQVFDAWLIWAILSACCAALAAIFAMVGIANVNSDFATLVRTVVIQMAAGRIVVATGHWQAPATVPVRTWVFLVLSGLAMGLSWICHFRALQTGQATLVALN